MFFTGYESQEDLDDPSKITIISLEDALEMEPLLETVLDKNGELCLPSGAECPLWKTVRTSLRRKKRVCLTPKLS